MSGVFGILDSRRKSPVAPLLRAMGTKMSHREWYVVDTYVDESSGVGLGRIDIGLFNRQSQPAFNQDQSLLGFMSGELYNVEEIRRRLKAKEHLRPDSHDLELVLQLYEERGEQFVHDLEGVFLLAIWDRRRQRLLIANDRFSLCPLMFAHYDGRLLFAPEMKGVLCDAAFSKKLDMVALAEYMSFQYLLGDKTFFEGIQLLPPASVLLYDLQRDSFSVAPYWDFNQIPRLPSSISFADAVTEAGRLLRRAVNRLCSSPHRIGVHLSGGLDSRTILGLIDREHFPIVSITYGQKGCRDVVYAERIAQKAGSTHHWFEFKDGTWVRDYAGFHLELTEGFHSLIHAHGISTLADARQLIDVSLCGLGGDQIMGGDLVDPLLINAPDELAFNCRLFHIFRHEQTWPSITEAEEKYLYTQKYYCRVNGAAFSSFLQELAPFAGYDLDRRGEYFSWYCADRRLFLNYTIFGRSHFEFRFPFYDYQLFDFVYSLPVEMRYEKRLHRALINREMPTLAMVPYDKDGLLISTRQPRRAIHTLVYKLKNRFNRHVWPLFPQWATLYADYENYLRHELRDWAESILFDRRTLERDIFNPRFIRSIWERHQAGREMWTIGKIAPIMTYEMMLRRFYD